MAQLGQCSELCGTLHGFMPIVVEVERKSKSFLASATIPLSTARIDQKTLVMWGLRTVWCTWRYVILHFVMMLLIHLLRHTVDSFYYENIESVPFTKYIICFLEILGRSGWSVELRSAPSGCVSRDLRCACAQVVQGVSGHTAGAEPCWWRQLGRMFTERRLMLALQEHMSQCVICGSHHEAHALGFDFARSLKSTFFNHFHTAEIAWSHFVGSWKPSRLSRSLLFWM